MSTDSNSTELTILTHAPQMVARAFDGARSTLGDNRERLRRKFAFVDTLLRYLFAVLAAENAGLGLPLPEGCTSLVNRLATPSWGDWAKAIEALARSILESGREPIAPEFPSLLIKTEESGELVRSAFFGYLAGLIELRNEVAHEDGSVFCTEGKAGQYLQERVNPALQQVAAGLRVFAKRPLLFLDGSRDLPDGDVVSTFLRLVGEKAEKQECRCDTRPTIRERYPFLLRENGAVLYLWPFIIVDGATVTGVPAPRLIDGWSVKSHQPTYDSPEGQRRELLAACPEGMPNSPHGLLSLSAKTFRRESAIDPDTAKVVASAHRMPVHVTIPGLEIDEERPLGTGASGTVYRSRWAPGGGAPREWLAVKVMRNTFLADVQRKRLEAEYNVLKAIQHKSLPVVHHFGYDPVPYILMEKIEGTSLQSRIDRRPLPLETVVWIAREVLEVLDVVHQREVIHRDLKPSNIMLNEDDTALKVIDFGIALTSHGRRVTGSLELVGTHGYAAPEQLAKGDVDLRADIFALGRVLHEALVGGRDDREETIPPGMMAIIRCATQPEREHRYRSAADMLQAINDRAEGGWAGIPVQEHSPLDGNHQLLSFKHTIDDVWIFDAIEMPTGRREAIALAVSPAARQRLVDAVRQQPDGSCTTQSTDIHSILFTILPPDHEVQRLECLMQGRRAWTAIQLPGGVEVSTEMPPAAPAVAKESPSLRDALLSRVWEIKHIVDAAENGAETIAACMDAASAMETPLLMVVMHQAGGGLTPELWRACPSHLGGIVAWVEKQLIRFPGSDELLASLRRVATIRNELAHARIGSDHDSVVHAIRYASTILGSAIEDLLPADGDGAKPPLLTFDGERQVWGVLRPLRGGDRYELYDSRWRRRYDLEDVRAAVEQGRSVHEAIQRKQALAAYLDERPYAHEVVIDGRSRGKQRRRREPSARMADVAVYGVDAAAILVAEVPTSPTTPVARLSQEELLWELAKSFEAPYALLEGNEQRTWFAVEGVKGLREMPDDSEIVARFPKAKPRA